MDKLTPKQELFVQGIISGLSQRQAYRQAYKAEKMTDVAVDVQASKLLKNPKITLENYLNSSLTCPYGPESRLSMSMNG